MNFPVYKYCWKMLESEVKSTDYYIEAEGLARVEKKYVMTIIIASEHYYV